MLVRTYGSQVEPLKIVSKFKFKSQKNTYHWQWPQSVLSLIRK